MGDKTLVIQDKTLRGGFTAIPNAVITSELSFGAKVIYTLLLMFAWQEKETFPGQKRLAEAANCSERTVRKYLTELKKAKLISWKQRGLTQTNVYYIKDLSLFLDRKERSGQDRKPSDRKECSCPDRKERSGQERKECSDKEYSDQEDSVYKDPDIDKKHYLYKDTDTHTSKVSSPLSKTEKEPTLQEYQNKTLEKKSEGNFDSENTGPILVQKTLSLTKETSPVKEKVPDNTPAEKKPNSDQEQLSLKETVPDNNTPVGKKTNKGKETLPVKGNDSNDNPLVSKADLIAVLGDTLREVWDGPPAKAYAIAGTLYNRYDYIAAEEAVNVFHRRKKEGFQPKNPVAYLMKIARETKKRYDNADKDGNASNYKESPDNRLTFAEKYPEEHKRRMEEVKRVYAEREQYHKEYIALSGEDPPVAIPGFITPGQVFEQIFGKER